MTGVSYDESEWTAPGTRRRLYFQVWKPESIQRLLVILHGFGEHGGRYRSVAEGLAGQGLAIVVPDLEGHGRSGGARGDIGSVSRCVEELRVMARDIWLPSTGQSGYSVFGHSFGGLVAIQWAGAERLLQRLVVQSPLLEVGFPVPWWKIGVAQLLARSWPAFGLPMDLDANKLSHDPRVAEGYRADSLVHNRMSARSYVSILNAAQEVMAAAPELRVPTLLLCGAEDQIVSVPAAKRWYEQLTCQKGWRVFPECFHELHHEAVKHTVLAVVYEWVVSQAREGAIG